jgi:acetyl esterase/lipase
MKAKTTTGLTLACLPVFVAVALAQPSATRESRLPEGAIAHRDFAYVPNAHERQKLDLYLPKDATNLPLIINIHGGAFKMGSKEQGVPTEYLAQGYAVASISYRLSQHAKFPAQIEDCKAAGRWLRAHANEYRLDPHHQSELLEAALKQAGVPVTFYTVKGAGHGGFKDPKVPEMTREFLAKRLKPTKSTL